MQQESEALQVVAKVRQRKDHVAAPPRPHPLGCCRHRGCCGVIRDRCVAAAGMDDCNASARVGALPGIPHEAGRHGRSHKHLQDMIALSSLTSQGLPCAWSSSVGLTVGQCDRACRSPAISVGPRPGRPTLRWQMLPELPAGRPSSLQEVRRPCRTVSAPSGMNLNIQREDARDAANAESKSNRLLSDIHA
jgi:hypothetical protein